MLWIFFVSDSFFFFSFSALGAAVCSSFVDFLLVAIALLFRCVSSFHRAFAAIDQYIDDCIGCWSLMVMLMHILALWALIRCVLGSVYTYQQAVASQKVALELLHQVFEQFSPEQVFELIIIFRCAVCSFCFVEFYIRQWNEAIRINRAWESISFECSIYVATIKSVWCKRYHHRFM